MLVRHVLKGKSRSSRVVIEVQQNLFSQENAAKICFSLITGVFSSLTYAINRGRSISRLTLAAMTLQRWYRQLRARWTKAKNVLCIASNLDAILGASAQLGAGPWGWEWESLCSENRGLLAHASALLRGVGLEWLLVKDKNSSEAALSALLIAAHPEVAIEGYGKGVGTTQEMQGVQLATAATIVRKTLTELGEVLESNACSSRIMNVVKQVCYAMVHFTIRREHCRGPCGTDMLADDLTVAAADVLEAIARTDSDLQSRLPMTMDQSMDVLYGYEQMITAGVARLEQLEYALGRLLGLPEAHRRMEAARMMAKQRIEMHQNMMLDDDGGVPLPFAGFESKGESSYVEESCGDDRSFYLEGLEEARRAHAETQILAQQHQLLLQQQEQHTTSLSTVSTTPAPSTPAPVIAHRQVSRIDENSEHIFDNEWLVHEICVLPQGRFLQVSLEDGGEHGHSARGILG